MDRPCSQYLTPQGTWPETILRCTPRFLKLAEIPLTAQEMEAGSDGLLSESVLMYKSPHGTRLSPLQHLGLQGEKPTHVCWSACACTQVVVGTRTVQGLFLGLRPPPPCVQRDKKNWA